MESVLKSTFLQSHRRNKTKYGEYQGEFALIAVKRPNLLAAAPINLALCINNAVKASLLLAPSSLEASTQPILVLNRAYAYASDSVKSTRIG